MLTATLKPKGQITIPAEIGERLGLKAGDQIDFVVEDNTVRLVRRQDRIEAIFGLYKAEVSMSDEEMARAVHRR